MKPGRAATFGKSAAQFLAGCVRQTVTVKPHIEPDGSLLEAVKQWQQVFEHNPVMYFMVDPAGTVINVNTFGAAQLGYTAAELIGRSVLDVFLEEDRAFVRACVALCLETVDQSHTWEIRKVRKDGSVLWVRENAKTMLRADGGPIVLVACENITERKEAENALRESEQRFRDYAETASDWFWETGPDHRVTLISEHSDTVAAPAGLIGLTRWDIAPDADLEPERWRQHRAALDAHVPFRDLVYRSKDRSGQPIYVRTSGKPFFDAEGAFLGYRGVCTDVTAAIRADQAEDALRKAQVELAHVTRVTTLGELTASIAHEINQPLAAVIANADACLTWLQRSPPDFKAARRSVEWIIEDGTRASDVIRRVRALAKRSDIEMVPLDANVVVREAVALVQREMASHAVSVRMELSSALPKIFGDRIQLQQVLINLIKNGIEAMDGVHDRPRELAIRSEADDDEAVLVSVTDCGAGICEQAIDRLFTPFFTTKSSGMGMGLSICRSIIEVHGGRLSAVPNQGRGATFQITLPRHREETS
ncbi:PAS domain-containing sensor histidine kinase [Bradyrhizobium monzae]|uniref:PAS domain-containing sensor histidine kinase n=1 Tax=Bradyrhizobium sp. Oc8 TaxID=2876780 RepID=UPI001F2FC460|nr:PAS domain S-box protein [Bradyrhizobium sp. Oc8]